MVDPLLTSALGWGLVSSGWLISPTITRLLNKAFDKLDTDVPQKLRDLESTLLPQLKIAIECAEKNRHKPTLELWLKKLRAAYYELEDVLDLVEYDRLEKEVNSHSRSSFKLNLKLSVLSSQKKYLRKSLTKLESIVTEAREFCMLLDLPTTSSRENSILSTRERQMSSTSLLQAEIIGRDKDRDQIVSLLREGTDDPETSSTIQKCYSVIGIHGVAGSGKTTLAQYVCKFESEAKYFDIIMWVHVSQNYNVHLLTNKMLESASQKPSPQFNNLDTLQRKLENKLKQKRFLLVLDDAWCDKGVQEDQVDLLFAPLRAGKRGSKILVTTRSKEAAKVLGAMDPLLLPELEHEQFLSLFMHHALCETRIDKKLEVRLRKIVEQIAEKLHRSPLAAKTVASQLHKNLDAKFWTSFLQKDLLNEDIMGALLLSFQHLDVNSQRCFAYCSIFPKGYRFKRNELVDLWMAEGFTVMQRMKWGFQDSFDELVSSSFLQSTKNDDEYFMHDILHDLAEKVSGDDWFRIEDQKNLNIPLEVVRLSVQTNRLKKHIKSICKLKNLRTLIFLREPIDCKGEVFHKILMKLNKLRVLSIFSNNMHMLPRSVNSLKHMRFLGLQGFNGEHFRPIFFSTSNLYHLQFIKAPNISLVPVGDLTKLISLKHLDCVFIQTDDFRKVKCLQKLSYFDLRYGDHELPELQYLSELQGSLHIIGLENVRSKEMALAAKLANKVYLDELFLEWYFYDETSNLRDSDMVVLEGLQAPVQLSKLHIIGYRGRKYPDWLIYNHTMLGNLQLLELSKCPFLESLSEIGELILQLQALLLRQLRKLVSLPTFPITLTQLAIDSCDTLVFVSKEELDMIRISDFTRTEEILEFLESAGAYSKASMCRERMELLYDLKISNLSSTLILPWSLQQLEITSCSITNKKLWECLSAPSLLNNLKLCDIMTITALPTQVTCRLIRLQTFEINGCLFLTSLGHLQNLTNLSISSCPDLRSDLGVSNTTNTLPHSLEILKISVHSYPVDLLHRLIHLAELHIENCPAMETLDISHLRALQTLILKNCSNLTSLWGLDEFLFGKLTIKECSKVAFSSEGKGVPNLLSFTTDRLMLLCHLISVDGLSSLVHLKIENSTDRVFTPGDTEVFQHLTSIETFEFEECKMLCLPDNLKCLPSLRCLAILWCPRVESLPDLPPTLQHFRLVGDNPLKEKLNQKNDPNWLKISTLPSVSF
jgi:ABC-type dipeptide/oligopeptide/nickel transport system ATPase subunit